MATGIAVAQTNQPAWASDLETDFVACDWHQPALGVQNFNGNDRKSSPSAAIFCRSVLSASLPGAPVVSRFSISTIRPDDEPRASSTPGAYFTFHSTCELRSIFFAPRVAPFKNSSTRSRLL